MSYTEEEEISVRDIFEFICTQPNALDGKRDCDLSSLTQKDIAEIDFNERSELECELVPSCRFLWNLYGFLTLLKPSSFPNLKIREAVNSLKF